MTNMEIQIAEGLATAQNNGIEATAKVAEILGRPECDSRLRIMLKELKPQPPEAGE